MVPLNCIGIKTCHQKNDSHELLESHNVATKVVIWVDKPLSQGKITLGMGLSLVAWIKPTPLIYLIYIMIWEYVHWLLFQLVREKKLANQSFVGQREMGSVNFPHIYVVIANYSNRKVVT